MNSISNWNVYKSLSSRPSTKQLERVHHLHPSLRGEPTGRVKWPAERPRAGITQMTYGNAFEPNWWWSFATFEPWDRRPSIISVRGSTSAQKLPSKRTFHKFITGYHLSFSQIYNDLLKVEKRGAFQSFASFLWRTLRGGKWLMGQRPRGKIESANLLDVGLKFESLLMLVKSEREKKVREWLSLISDSPTDYLRVNWETRFLSDKYRVWWWERIRKRVQPIWHIKLFSAKPTN